MRRGLGVSLILTVCAAMLVLVLLGARVYNEPAYTVFSHRRAGTGMLYNRLKQMGYPVSIVYAPVQEAAGVRDAQVVIRPDNPVPDVTMLKDMLEWVYRGGRLIYMDDAYPTVMDMALVGFAYTELGNMTHYYVGAGEVVTGFAKDITNSSLEHGNQHGLLFQYTLEAWGAEQVFFNEYYHGYRETDHFFTRMPSVFELAAFQLLITAAAYTWYRSRRSNSQYRQVNR